jgi:hypothetical protein
VPGAVLRRRVLEADLKVLEDEIRTFFRDQLGQHLPSRKQINIRCPLHADREASFSMDLATGLWMCHSGCGHGNFPQFQARLRKAGTKPDLSDLPPGMQEEIEAEEAEERGEKRSIFYYPDEIGNELYRVVRVDRQDGSKSFSSESRTAEGKYRKSLKCVRRVLYRLQID